MKRKSRVWIMRFISDPNKNREKDLPAAFSFLISDKITPHFMFFNPTHTFFRGFQLFFFKVVVFLC